MLKTKLAAVSGFCGDENFGVARALGLARQAGIADPGNTYLVGDLVHNREVSRWLEKFYQIKIVKNLAQVPKGKVVIIKAHGVSPTFIKQAKERELKIIDATCPLVRSSQIMVKKIIASGKQVIFVASDKKHDEAVSVSSQVERGVKIVTLDELTNLMIKRPDKTVLLTQTTLSVLETSEQLKQLAKRYPQLTIQPHICPATTQRQQAVLDLAKEVDFLLVVGEPHSSNTCRLLEVAKSTGKPAAIVGSAKEINQSWFGQTVFVVGIIAGASTPTWIIKAVQEKIESLGDHHQQFSLKNLTNYKSQLKLTSGISSAQLKFAEGRQTVLAGLNFATDCELKGKLDGDLLIQALAQAISSFEQREQLELYLEQLESEGKNDSRFYLQYALALLRDDCAIASINFALYDFPFAFAKHFVTMRASLASLLNLPRSCFTFCEKLATQANGSKVFLSPWCQVQILWECR